ncbi:MAG: hypothetical protein A3A10_00055, partial [Candidatus Tagabacteria bacterium RIFCSPLOWO2_01_FULL_42_9]
NSWGGHNSVSGRGSDLDQTEHIIREIPALFKDMGISTVLDIPCGDFNWMRNIDLSGIKYIGADIVKEIVKNNKNQYEKNNVSFRHMNLIEDTLPQVDLILIRDCLVHMSYDDIFKLLNNVCNSMSQYLLTTSFTDRQDNKDIITGEWRPLNLQIAPFSLPKPIRIINEKCTQGKSSYTDKSLGLWKISDIAKILKNIESAKKECLE